jgi:hypothetical protein
MRTKTSNTIMKSLRTTISLAPKMASAVKDHKMRLQKTTGIWQTDADVCLMLIREGIKRLHTAYPDETPEAPTSTRE